MTIKNKMMNKQPNTKTTEQFIKEAKNKWGDKYNYSKVKYINTGTKVEIICNKCNNVFFQRPNDHARYGCPHCAGNAKKTKEQFIKEAINVLGDNYDYSKADYKNTETKIEIICKKCEYSFFRKPCEHIKNTKGCFNCKKIAINNPIRQANIKAAQKERYDIKQKQNKIIRLEKRLNDFITEAKQKHGDKYDYSKCIYKDYKTKMNIICNKCNNSFKQFIYDHLITTHCCHHCYSLEVINNIKQFKDDFIKKAINVHGNKYDYSKINYININTPIEIVCKNGNKSFFQKPNRHLINGCPICNKNKTTGDSKIFLKDGAIMDSMIEAYHYILLKNNGIQSRHHEPYGGELGSRLYDFYIPLDNKYIEVTGFNKGNYGFLTNQNWISYLRNIVIKKKYVEKIGAKFEFVQYKKLNTVQLKYVRSYLL